MLGWVDRISKNDDVAAMHFAIRKKMIPDTVSAITQFIDQQIIPDQERVLHGLRRNLEGLHDEGDDEYRDHHCRQQGLQGGRPIGLMLFYNHDRLRTRLGSPFTGSGRDARYSSTWRAASCSAFFLVEPSARPTQFKERQKEEHSYCARRSSPLHGRGANNAPAPGPVLHELDVFR